MTDDVFTNAEVSELFDTIADLMEILGEDRFRIIAYRKAGAALRAVTVPLVDWVTTGHQAARLILRPSVREI